jgi:hypothetical protein
MKYLKTYENSQFKKYAIIKLGDNSLCIIKIIEIEGYDRMKVMKLYNLIKNYIHEYNTNNITYLISISKQFTPKLIMQSDNIEELLDYFNMLISLNKYNL